MNTIKVSLALVIISISSVFAQPGKKDKTPKMAPSFADGYYVSLKGDTVKGQVGISNEDETAIYRTLMFKQGSGKLTAISSKKAKSYGFEGRHFTIIPFDNAEVYIEYLVKGRINFLVYKFNGKINGEPGIEKIYFVQDTRPGDEKDKELKTLKQISQKFYKKDLKPYLKDQTQIWNDMDKFSFNETAICNSIKEFNKFYETSSSE
ncbi:MAG: hypothetical protein JSU07_12155 [Bacteroidetes bacterium]|nr:hypothetical protein [Bacteroidota bacterium]